MKNLILLVFASLMLCSCDTVKHTAAEAETVPNIHPIQIQNPPRVFFLKEAFMVIKGVYYSGLIFEMYCPGHIEADQEIYETVAVLRSIETNGLADIKIDVETPLFFLAKPDSVEAEVFVVNVENAIRKHYSDKNFTQIII